MRKPIKLYCIKDYEPGEWLTKGKIYELFGNLDCGEITFDDGYEDETFHYSHNPFDMETSNLLVPLVSRHAEDDEWVYVNEAQFAGHDSYVNGDVMRVIKVQDNGQPGIYVQTASGKTHPCCKEEGTAFLYHSEYLVLDGYKPETEGEKKMKYSVGDRVLIRRDITKTALFNKYSAMRNWQGKEMTISKVFHDGYGMKEDGGECMGNSNNWNGWIWTDSMIERKVDMTKDDLKTGKYMVKCRNGYFGNTVEGTNYVNGLTDEFNDAAGDARHDLMEIYELKLVWKREETVKMTMEEINAALGKNVEVVEKH